MDNEYDYEVASAREWLGLDQDSTRDRLFDFVTAVFELGAVAAFIAAAALWSGLGSRAI
jgi:hypothetical protein